MPKMKNATRMAPHICFRVRANTCLIIDIPGRSSSTITIHEARMELPPLHGVKLKTDASGLPVTEEIAVAFAVYQLIFPRLDQGPVHATTTTNSTKKGSHARNAFTAAPASSARSSCTSGIILPPKPRMFFGRQTFTKRYRIQKETSAPLMSGRYGPRKCDTGHWPNM